MRVYLLAGVLAFVRAACTLPGVTRIALIGSLTSGKPNPKDADMLVTVADDMDLGPLATLGRKLKGYAQQRNLGADIFLVNPDGVYLGRICHWKECYPGIRMSCNALHCGWRQYLHDDLQVLTLRLAVIAAPRIELWPSVNVRGHVPSDVREQLLVPLSQEPTT
jgi:hypothetical protein